MPNISCTLIFSARYYKLLLRVKVSKTTGDEPYNEKRIVKKLALSF